MTEEKPSEGKPLDLDESLRLDEKEDLRRRLGETAEQLAAAEAKDCPSCGAEFTKGVGAVAKKPKTDEEKAAFKKKMEAAKAAKAAAAKATAAPAAASAPADAAEDEDDGGFAFF